MALMKRGPIHSPDILISGDLAHAIKDGYRMMFDRTGHTRVTSAYVLWGIVYNRNEVSDLLLEYGIEDEIVLKKMRTDSEK